MLKFNTHYNTLDEPLYHYQLQDVKEPNLYRDIYNYEEIPKVTFNRRRVPMSVPDEIWITDTTFRDGQQSRAPYTVEQIAALYEMLHRLGGPKGLIRQSEFFLYSEKDRRAVEKCREMGFEFPEITGWIRAKKEDFLLAKEMGLKECGILVSCSDYHIFKKLGLTRKQALDMYLGIIKDALSVGIVFASMGQPIWEPSLVIGLVTFVLCMAGFFIGKKAGAFFGIYAQTAGGAVLIFIGVRILLSHLLES